MTPEKKLLELGIELPAASAPLGAYVPAVRSGNFLFVSGTLPLRDGKLLRTGKVGADLTLEEAREEARQAAVNGLSAVKTCMGDLSKVKRCVKVTGFVSSDPGFTDQPRVLNAASELLFEVFGEAGRHARAAVGVNVLPLDSPLELEFIFEVE